MTNGTYSISSTQYKNSSKHLKNNKYLNRSKRKRKLTQINANNANNANKRECFVCSPSAHYTIIKLYMDGLILCLHKMHRSNYLRVLAFICVVRVFFCF